MTNRKVAILLSTYNGEKWLPDLLLSLEKQIGLELTLIFRDDNSCDLSRKIVLESNLQVMECECIPKNIGAALSFKHLLGHSLNYKYVAFCDQDDYWFEDKLTNAINILASKQGPACIGSSVVVTEYNHEWPRNTPVPSHLNSIFQNIIMGCTLVLNHQAAQIVHSSDLPEGVMHDHLTYFLISNVGEVIFMSRPSLYYRLHEFNDTGIRDYHNKSHSKSIIHRFISYKRRTRVLLKLSPINDSIRPSIFLNRLKAKFYRQNHALARKQVFRQNQFENFIVGIMFYLYLI